MEEFFNKGNKNELTEKDFVDLIMTANKGTIYYTTDGSDPVIWNTTPVVSPVAIKSPFSFTS